MTKNKIQHETERSESVKYACNMERNYFNNKIKNIFSNGLVSGSIFDEAYQHLQAAVEFILNNIH